MTIIELLNYCVENDIPLTTQMAIRAKDDFLVMPASLFMDRPYFGNCREGSKLERETYPRDADNEIDYDNAPEFLILDAGR